MNVSKIPLPSPPLPPPTHKLGLNINLNLIWMGKIPPFPSWYFLNNLKQ